MPAPQSRNAHLPPPPASVLGASTRPAPAPAPTELCTEDKAIQHLQLLSNAAVGVVFIRTREPGRVSRALTGMAWADGYAFHEWDNLRGWITHHRGVGESKPTQVTVGQLSPINALKWVGGLPPDPIPGQPASATAKPSADSPTGIFLMQWSHFWHDKEHRALTCIRLYTELFAGDRKDRRRRLYMLIPEGTEIPREIQHEVQMYDFALPDRTELREGYNALVTSLDPKFSTPEVESILDLGSGMTQGEFASAVSVALISHRPQLTAGQKISLRSFCRELHKVKCDVVRRSRALEMVDTDGLSIEDVGGLTVLKPWLLSRRARLTKEARDAGVVAPKGILMVGPPGTGKSLVAKVAGVALGLPVVKFNISKVFGGIVGQTESTVAATLATIEALGNCVVWLDEVDKAGINPNQGGGDGGVSSRVLNQILTHMQEKRGAFWVMTANWPDKIDSALVRKGRLDEIWAILPPNAAERLEILKIHLRKCKQNADEIEGLEELAADASLEGFTGAEIEVAVQEAVGYAFEQGQKLTSGMIRDQFAHTKPIKEAYPEQYRAMASWAEANARAATLQLQSDILPEIEVPASGRNLE